MGVNVEVPTAAPEDILLVLLSRPRSTAYWMPYLNVSLPDQRSTAALQLWLQWSGSQSPSLVSSRLQRFNEII
jgi:hypothetical protein